MTAELEQKLAHWRSLRGAVEHCVLLHAATLPTEELQQWVLAFNVACGQIVEGAMFSDAGWSIDLRSRVLEITLEDLLDVYATIYLGYMSCQRCTHESSDWQSLMEFAELIYLQSKATVSRWTEFVLENEGSDAIASRTAYRLNDELSPVFGLRKNDPLFANGWLPLICAIAATTQSLIQEPQWPGICRARIGDAATQQERPIERHSGCASTIFAVVISGLAYGFLRMLA